MPSLAHLCILLSGFFCEVGVGGWGVLGEGHLNLQMGTRPEKTLGRSLKYVGTLSKLILSLQGKNVSVDNCKILNILLFFMPSQSGHFLYYFSLCVHV